MDAVYLAHERLRAREERAYSRAVMTGNLAMMAMGGKQEAIEKIMRAGHEHGTNRPYEVLEGAALDALRPPAKPYPVHPVVARGLGRALALGLLTGAPWASWPFTPEGLPLPRVWDRIEAAQS